MCGWGVGGGGKGRRVAVGGSEYLSLARQKHFFSSCCFRLRLLPSPASEYLSPSSRLRALLPLVGIGEVGIGGGGRDLIRPRSSCIDKDVAA